MSIFSFLPFLSSNAQSASVYVGFLSSYGAGGYDVVAYHTESAAVPGNNSYVAEWNGAKWRFKSEQNKEKFVANPEKYAPKYGGYCAWAVAQGYLARGNPSNWTVHNGDLYLNYNRSIQNSWEADKDGFITKSESNWPNVLAR
ncbi:MAG: YHS domain-containing protein [Alphaproteobacteria bacterium]|nr:YHS domain-containing protein [Alphaproteobacteria bacterium]